MRTQILATTTVLTLLVGATTTVMASAPKKDHHGRHVRHVQGLHAGGIHGHAAKRGSRSAAARDLASWRQGGGGYHGGFIDLGPLGITAACGSYSYRGRHCGQGYSVSAWTY